jgi:hypothetical protein
VAPPVSPWFDWALAFACTQLIEVPITVRVTGSFRTSFLASALTHPVVWFIFPLVPLGYWAMIACAEAFAVAVEAWWLARHGVRRALLISLLANGASFGIGLLLRDAFGVP